MNQEEQLMMKQRSLLHAVIGAAILSLAGAGAYAADEKPGASGRTGMESGAASGGSSMSGGTQAAITAKKGMDVVNADGEKVGEIEQVIGDQIIVSVGGFLGIGDRNVALNKSQLTMKGSGADAKLQTALSKQALQDLPEHKQPAGATGSSQRGSRSPDTNKSDGASQKP
jgi:hypothetical protein